MSSLFHLTDRVLARGLAAVVAQDCTTTARMLAYIAEFDRRKLYLKAAYPSMFSYCVGELRMSEDAAFRRASAAKIARRFPVLFDQVAAGEIHLTGLLLLGPHLTDENHVEVSGSACGSATGERRAAYAACMGRWWSTRS